MSKTPKTPPTCQPIESKSFEDEPKKLPTQLIQLQINLTDCPHNRSIINNIESIALQLINHDIHGVTISDHVSIKKSIQQIIDLKVRK
jgi:hypothetical protein